MCSMKTRKKKKKNKKTDGKDDTLNSQSSPS